jgi:hypothetical protein
MKFILNLKKMINNIIFKKKKIKKV